MQNRFVFVFISLLTCVSCSPGTVSHSPENDLGLAWVRHAAEYTAITMQTYQEAGRDLSGFLDDKSWSALPEQENAENLPPAVILDVDETVVANAEFQLSFERPITHRKLYDDYSNTDPSPVPGVIEFITAARHAGVAVYFVTNRPCEQIDDDPDPCPQKRATVRQILKLGIETDAAHVLLSNEQGWDRAKIGRRAMIAATHRVIMLFGDDLGDFVPCVRIKLYGPCTEPATKASRERLVKEYSGYWGEGWYLVPGPMHGSWTKFP